MSTEVFYFSMANHASLMPVFQEHECAASIPRQPGCLPCYTATNSFRTVALWTYPNLSLTTGPASNHPAALNYSTRNDTLPQFSLPLGALNFIDVNYRCSMIQRKAKTWAQHHKKGLITTSGIWDMGFSHRNTLRMQHTTARGSQSIMDWSWSFSFLRVTVHTLTFKSQAIISPGKVRTGEILIFPLPSVITQQLRLSMLFGATMRGEEPPLSATFWCYTEGNTGMVLLTKALATLG